MSPEQTVIDAELIPSGTDVIRYHPDEAALAELRQKYAGLDAAVDYDACRLAIRELISCRSQVEQSRQAYKRGLIDRGRRIDRDAAKVTKDLLAIETPLRASKETVDAEKEAAARALVEAEQARLAAIEKAAKDAEEARLKAIRDAEQAALAAERAALAKEREASRQERERLDSERRAAQEAIDADNVRLAAMLKEERARLGAEQAAVKAEQQRLERIEWERQANERAQKEAAARAKESMERAAREQQAKWEQECAAAEAEKVAERQRQSEMEIEVKRIEAARPDVDKIRGIAKTMLKAIALPAVKNESAKAFVAQLKIDLEALANRCLAFKVTNGKKGQS